jgi:hypothetical protein
MAIPPLEASVKSYYLSIFDVHMLKNTVCLNEIQTSVLLMKKGHR